MTGIDKRGCWPGSSMNRVRMPRMWAQRGHRETLGLGAGLGLAGTLPCRGNKATFPCVLMICGRVRQFPGWQLEGAEGDMGWARVTYRPGSHNRAK
jgi:hypothetical protein